VTTSQIDSGKKVISATREKLEKSLLLFGRILQPRAFIKRTPEFHKELNDYALNESVSFLNIIAPRGTAKSTLMAEYKPIHHIMYDKNGSRVEGGDDGNEPTVRKDAEPRLVVICSKTQGHSINRLQAIKDVFEYSSTFRQLYGYWGKHSAQKWTDDEIILKDGTAVVCKGTGQHLRGLKYICRPTLIIIDDPEDENNTKTPEAMESNLRWLLKAVKPARDIDYNGRIIMIGTPLHQRCLVMTAAQMSDWHTLHYDYIIEHDDGSRSSLWPEKLSIADLDRELKALDEIGRASMFYSEYRCQVIGDEDQLVTYDLLRFYRGNEYQRNGEKYMKMTQIGTPYKDGLIWKTEWADVETEDQEVPINIFMGVDPASSTNQRADFTVVFPVGISKGRKVYCLPYFRQRVKPMGAAVAVQDKFKLHNPKKTNIESVGYQEMLKDYLRQQDEYIPGLEIPHNPRNKKSARLESLQPWFYRNLVFIREDQQEFIDELLLYPRGSHDDTLDAFYYALQGIYEPYHEVGEPTEKKPTTISKLFKNWKTI